MPSIKLTEAYLRSVTPPQSGRLEINDAVCRGLALRVTPAGVKSWSFRYRNRISGDLERLSLGPYPTIPLAGARALADAHRVSVASNKSPARELKRSREAARSAITFAELLDRYWAYAKARKKASTLQTEANFIKPFVAKFGPWRVTDITRDDVDKWLKAKATQAPVAANRTVGILSSIFKFAVHPSQAILSATPIVAIEAPGGVERERNRILFDDEIPVLWTAFETLMPPLERAMKVHLLLGQRPGEIAVMEIDELHGLENPDEARWEIPATKMKGARLHVVPLPPLALSLIRAAIADRPMFASGTPWVFPSPRKMGAPIDRHSLSRALTRVLDSLDGDDRTIKRLKTDRPTPHDFRRTVSSSLPRLKVPREHAKAVLGHRFGDVQEKHYDRYDYLVEKREALSIWSHHVAKLVGIDGQAPEDTRWERKK